MAVDLSSRLYGNPYLPVFPPSAKSTKVMQATAVCIGERCVVLCWQRMHLFSLILPMETQRRPRSCLFAQPGLSWKPWVRFAVQPPNRCCVTISSKSATPPGLDLLQNLFAGNINQQNTFLLVFGLSLILYDVLLYRLNLSCVAHIDILSCLLPSFLLELWPATKDLQLQGSFMVGFSLYFPVLCLFSSWGFELLADFADLSLLEVYAGLSRNDAATLWNFKRLSGEGGE